jgi:2-methylcitrate dehydratase PrpD
MALALAGSNGRPARPMGEPSGRWFIFGEAVLKGIRASIAAGQGFQGDLALLSPAWLAMQAGHNATDFDVLESAAAPLLSDVGFKPLPIARQAANAVAGFQTLLSRGLDCNEIDRIDVFVPAMNVALISRSLQPSERLSRLSNMGYQLACAALAPEMLYDSERTDRPTLPLIEFAARVNIFPESELEVYLPHRWPARIAVQAGKRRIEETLIALPFDCDAPELAQRLKDKWHRLLSPDEMQDFSEEIHASREALWQIIQGHVSMAAQSKREPEPK